MWALGQSTQLLKCSQGAIDLHSCAPALRTASAAASGSSGAGKKFQASLRAPGSVKKLQGGGRGQRSDMAGR